MTRLTGHYDPALVALSALVAILAAGAALAEVKVLKGILPICATCKRIKNETGGWEAVESFVHKRTNAEFSHGLCPDRAARDWGTAPSTSKV